MVSKEGNYTAFAGTDMLRMVNERSRGNGMETGTFSMRSGDTVKMKSLIGSRRHGLRAAKLKAFDSWLPGQPADSADNYWVSPRVTV